MELAAYDNGIDGRLRGLAQLTINIGIQKYRGIKQTLKCGTVITVKSL